MLKVLTADQMRQVDRRSMELGIPGIVLMENAGHRVTELLAEKFSPLSRQRVVVLCGKGNNGGDGMVVARQLFTRFRPLALHVVLAADPAELKGDAAANYHMLVACGCAVSPEITVEMRLATVVVDALLGTGLSGAAHGRMAELIGEINDGFPLARVVAVDIPSGMQSDTADSEGEIARADYTVTFTAPKVCHAVPPNCDCCGELRIGAIGSPASLYENDPAVSLSLLERRDFAHLFAGRPRGAHKGSFGHVLIVGGSTGKTGAAAMAGLAALRAGAGLVTVASAASAIASIAAYAPEMMTEPLAETDSGGISADSLAPGCFDSLVRGKTVVGLGPGIGAGDETFEFVRRVFAECDLPLVVDADGLNALAGTDFGGAGRVRVLTPHPGEMARLAEVSTAHVQAHRIECARALATERRVTVVLKGQHTLLAFPDGRVWINDTGTPAMATGGSGDILTGLIAGLFAQFPKQPELAVAAAVWLHGKAGEIAAGHQTEQAVIATDILRYLPDAIRAVRA